MGLRNLPTDEARSVAGLIENRPGQVSSMGLTAGGSVDFMLMAFSAGESVSEEEYFGDTLYHVVEGMVPARIPHAVEGHEGAAFKLLQLTIPEERRGASDGTH